MAKRFNRILIIADIEGSSGCWNYRASSFMTQDWGRACAAMTRDVNAVVTALFESGSLAPFGIRPIFYSGCPTACEQARAAIPHIFTYSIEKKAGPERFDAVLWRSGLARYAGEALANDQTVPYRPEGPFRACVKMRDGEAVAKKLADRWNLGRQNDRILVTAASMRELYKALIRICYLTPLVEKILPVCLIAYNLWGRIGLAWVRRQINKRPN